ncbi:hypothetical protein ABID12_002051 [Martelella mangrovi]|uniref:Uncharacterized protein n=1 Tax=Martelella mangrovi TaxID=1397477 RepID=A0ABV2IBF8_9HYPH
MIHHLQHSGFPYLFCKPVPKDAKLKVYKKNHDSSMDRIMGIISGQSSHVTDTPPGPDRNRPAASLAAERGNGTNHTGSTKWRMAR